MADTPTRTLPDPAAPAADSTATAGTAPDPRPRGPVTIPDIPRYAIVRPIGRGGMGVVYEAVGPLGVRVALKVIHPEKISPTLLARFRQEARAMMDLDHPHLARIYDYGEHAAGPYFTMKLLSGRTLADLLPGLWRDPGAAVRLAAQVAGAVGFIHARQKVHRDLKPNNVLLGDRDEPYVSDFGLIKELAGADADSGPSGPATTPARGRSTTLTQTGARMGTEAYMSPEQLAGDLPRIGPPADVYALGVMLHEMVWCARPEFDAAGALRPPDPPGADDPPEAAAFRARLLPVVARCLALEPQGRYQSGEELRRDLNALLDAPPEAPPSPSPTRRRFLVAAGVGVLGLSGAAAVRWAINRNRKDAPPRDPDPLAAVQAELAEKGSVDLLGPDGRWRWHEWVAGEGEWVPGAPVDGPADSTGWFRAPDRRLRLLEVVRGLGSGFRLVAEVAHVGPAGEVGVYVGRSRHAAEQGLAHCLMGVRIRDHGVDPGPGGEARLERVVMARRCPDVDPRGFYDARRLLEEYPPGAPGWTAVAIELTEGELVVTLGGREVVRRTRNQLLVSARDLGIARKGAGAVTPTFQPADGVGLFAYNSAVAVRAARVERIGPA